MRDPACPSCGREVGPCSPGIVQGDRRTGLAGSWTYAECIACGCLFMHPLPSLRELEAWYREYGQTDQTPVRQTRYPGLHRRFRRVFHKLSGDVDPRDILSAPLGSRVLDFGCGRGSYLHDLRAQGLDPSGAEIGSHLVADCRIKGLDVSQVDGTASLPFADREFAVVYLLQVFEHLRQPHEFMNEFARVVKPGGTLLIAVPNTRSIWRRVFGTNWVSGWFPPYHLFHYDRQVLEGLATAHGFELVRAWSTTPDSWLRLNLKAAIYSRSNHLNELRTWLDSYAARVVLSIVLRLVEIPFRERDCLVVQLRRHG